MNKGEGSIPCAEEIKKLVIREKGNVFWEEFVKGIEESQRDNFIDGYKYAIRLLEDGLKEKK
ncbi:hypothetical protein LI221_09905 [Faecalimonas umbilicata]|nr:hypothetical protein [Faecalimonas umbilicata]